MFVLSLLLTGAFFVLVYSHELCTDKDYVQDGRDCCG